MLKKPGSEPFCFTSSVHNTFSRVVLKIFPAGCSVQYANITPLRFPRQGLASSKCSPGSLFEFSLQTTHSSTRWLPLLVCLAPSDLKVVGHHLSSCTTAI